MTKEKPLGNDGLTLTKEFYSCFKKLKDFFAALIRATKRKMEFTSSQKRAFIKLIQEKDRHKKFIKNRCTISLLNIDNKIVSKALPARLKNLLSSLITHLQTAYNQNRCISQTGRLIPNISDWSFSIHRYCKSF